MEPARDGGVPQDEEDQQELQAARCYEGSQEDLQEALRGHAVLSEADHPPTPG